MARYDLLLLIEADLKEGIFLPSKMADYSGLTRPIFAITPKGSCVAELIESYGGGICVDVSSCDAIFKGIEQLYHLWRQDRSLCSLWSEQLTEYFSEERIIEAYESMFEEVVG